MIHILKSLGLYYFEQPAFTKKGRPFKMQRLATELIELAENDTIQAITNKINQETDISNIVKLNNALYANYHNVRNEEDLKRETQLFTELNEFPEFAEISKAVNLNKDGLFAQSNDTNQTVTKFQLDENVILGDYILKSRQVINQLEKKLVMHQKFCEYLQLVMTKNSKVALLERYNSVIEICEKRETELMKIERQTVRKAPNNDEVVLYEPNAKRTKS